MIWFFDRDGQRLRYEIRRTESGDGYELTVTHPDGRVEAEQLLEPAALLKRCSELVETLRNEGWRIG